MTTTVGEVVDVLERAYPPRLASGWDTGIGLTCGDPSAPVERVLLAVDAVAPVFDEAIACGAQLVVTHHPLLFSGVQSVATTTPKGALLDRLIRAGVALYSAHTNADHANPGVSDALAAALGLRVVAAIEPIEGEPVPGEPVSNRDGDACVGTGRIGVLDAPMTLVDFAARVAQALPVTAHGVHVAGDLDRLVERVAVCGGAGDDLLDDVAHSVDVYVTADLRHHPVQEHLTAGGCAVVDVAHWASEWPWLEQAASVLATGLAARGATVETVISTTATDAWALALR